MLFFSSVLMLVSLTSFSLSSMHMNYKMLFNIFIEMKCNFMSVVKLMSMLLVFLFMNYNSYIYSSLGLSMMYGYVLIMALSLVSYSWVLWLSNNWQIMISHFLPVGIDGVLKFLIPLLEIIGMLIRPLTLGVRLATNISCGHVVSSMFSYFACNSSGFLVVSISVLLFGLYFIESLVCLIQAYVSRSLLYIYSSDIEL